MITDVLGHIMNFCYSLIKNYGLSILLFTFISKIILLPLSIWVQKNSIKMVKMQPEINKIKINFFGDKDKIADEQSKLFKKENYNVLASLIPLFIQIILLICLIGVINHPLTYLLEIPENLTDSLINISAEKNNLNKESSSLEINVVKDIKNKKYLNDYSSILESDDIKKISDLNLNFLGFDLTNIASVELGLSVLVPFLAAFSALLLSLFQNKINILQSEQSNINKYGTLSFSVFLSLYLGFFVPAGVAFYWIFSNLLAIIQQILLNIIINPKKNIDFEELDKTNKELKKLNQISKKNKLTKIEKNKSREDYKRFFKILNKHLVFYSESNGFYKYYKGIIEYLLNNTNITIHYITSDFYDNIFNMAKENTQIKAYFIDDKRLITLMMKMDADVVVMTMPDLQNYHIKRSYIKKDIEYIYIPHGMNSLNLTMRERSMNSFDTVFAVGPHQYEEAVKTNEVYNLKNRKIIKWGYTLLDDMIEFYQKNKVTNEIPKILIAPSWQKDNIIDLCLENLLDNIKNKNYEIIVRPHPQEVKLKKDKFISLKEKYKNFKNICFETDFTSNETVFNADILISDWSGVAFEYSFTTKKPVIFIDTPMKIMNPEYKNLDIEPFNIWIRKEMGKVIAVDDLDKINIAIEDLIKNYKKYQTKITNLTNTYVYNIGTSREVGDKYIISSIKNKIKERKEKENEK